MQKFLLFEWLTGGGHRIDGDLSASSDLLGEADIMVTQLAHDLANCQGIQVILPRDRSLPCERFGSQVDFCFVGAEVDGNEADLNEAELKSTVRRAASNVDGLILIAPEPGQRLKTVADWFGDVETEKWFSPRPDLIELASSKQKSAEWLNVRGVPAVQGFCRTFPDDPFPASGYPLVFKPDDGAGSDSVHWVDSLNAAKQLKRRGKFRVEPFLPGVPVSVGCLLGPSGPYLLPGTRQRFSQHPIGHYIGFDFPLSAEHERRAHHLARRVVAALPSSSRGYVGIDMVLPDLETGAGDCVIEINPRLTTSFAGLSQLCQGNLGQAMLDVASGVSPSLQFPASPVKYRISEALTF